MTLLDQRGRLFGRLNLVDAGVAALLVGAAAVAFTGFRVFRMPRGPEIAALEPATQPAARGAHLTVRGRDFLPFLRVFVRRSEEAGLVHPDEKPADDYTLVNHTQAKWAVESPSLATVQLPDDVAPGTYDLMFYDETRLLTIRGAAFRLSPPPASATKPATAVVQLEGDFTKLEASDAQALTPGARLTSSGTDESAEILAAGAPRPDVVAIADRAGVIPAAVAGRTQVRATLRVHCTVADATCQIGGVTAAAGKELTLALGGRSVRFAVDAIASDLTDAVGDADVAVRFVVVPEEAALMKAGDHDTGSSAIRGPRHTAVLARITSRAPVTQRRLETVDKVSRWIDEPAVRVDAVLRVPVTRLDGVWFYNGLAIKSGGTLPFETTIYKARAWVLTVAVRAPGTGTE